MTYFSKKGSPSLGPRDQVVSTRTISRETNDKVIVNREKKNTVLGIDEREETAGVHVRRGFHRRRADRRETGPYKDNEVKGTCTIRRAGTSRFVDCFSAGAPLLFTLAVKRARSCNLPSKPNLLRGKCQ